MEFNDYASYGQLTYAELLAVIEHHTPVMPEVWCMYCKKQGMRNEEGQCSGCGQVPERERRCTR